MHACMLQKGAIPRKLNPENFIHSKYTRYTVPYYVKFNVLAQKMHPDKCIYKLLMVLSNSQSSLSLGIL